MKKIISTISSLLLSVTALFAQPVLHSDSLHTGLSFNLYSLSNVNLANLDIAGAGVTWDMSATTATLGGTADFLEMSATPFAAQYPAANFAMKFTIGGSPAHYSLFNLSSTVLEEVANNVGTVDETPFTNYRTTLVFPYTFNLSDLDTYQKTGQNQKSITNTYDGYGTFITNTSTYNNVVRIPANDDGNISLHFWSSSPFLPLFQAGSDGLVLWQVTSSPTGITEVSGNNVFDIYPNPATEEIKIVNKELISKVEIFDAAGQLQITTVKSTIDVSKLKTGTYSVKAHTKTGVVSQKFVKK